MKNLNSHVNLIENRLDHEAHDAAAKFLVALSTKKCVIRKLAMVRPVPESIKPSFIQDSCSMWISDYITKYHHWLSDRNQYAFSYANAKTALNIFREEECNETGLSIMKDDEDTCSRISKI